MKLKYYSRSLNISAILLILVGFLIAYPISLSASHSVLSTGEALGAITQIQSPIVRRNMPPGLAEATFVSHADPAEPISIVIALDLRDHAGADALIEAQQDPASSLYHQWITPEEFQSRFGPLSTDLQATRDFLSAQGFTGITQPTSTMIAADGNVDLAERAFQITINQYTYNDRSVYSNDRAPILPAELASKVARIGGLDNLSIMFASHHAETLIDPDYVLNGNNFMLSRDSQIGYGQKAGYFDMGKKGTPGAELAIASSFDIQLSDVNDQMTRQGGSAAGYNLLTSASSGAHTVSSTCVPNSGSGTGCTFVNGANHSSLETIWDVSLSSSVANENHIGVYLAQSQLTTSFAVVYQYIADRASTIKVVSHSWGLCLSLMPPGDVISSDNAFAQAAAGGQAWFVATGDHGSNDCNGAGVNPDVEYPASSPYVTGAGGSELNLLAPGTFGADGWLTGYPANGETGCSNGGGGQATTGPTEPRPSWQTGTGVPSGTKRLVPDISMHYGQCGSPGNGKQYVVMIGGSSFTVAGTSGDAPQWAGYWSVGNQVVTQAGGSLGQAGPLVFRILRNEAGSSYANSFHDITTGSNGAFSATVGYDQATGVGTPKWNNLYTDLARFFGGGTTRTLTVASSNPSSGVSITVSPNDNNGQGNGVTQFTRIYNTSTVVNLTAPSTAAGNTFQKWQRDGVDFAATTSTNVTMDANHTMTAVYVPSTRTLTIASLNPLSGVTITVSPNDNNSQGNGVTQFTRIYNNNAVVMLTAPATAGANTFQKWQRDGVDFAITTSTNITMDANHTMTAIFATPGGPHNPSTTGVFRPTNGALYLKNSNTTGFADLVLTYGSAGDYPVAGDWNGDGVDTIGVYRNGTFYLRNSNTNGFADIVVQYGQPGDQPVVGDWNGDGIDTIGVFRSGTFLLRNSNTPGPPDIVFGLGGPGDVGIAGDWDGDGIDTTGVYRPSNGALYLKFSNTTGFADLVLTYGSPGDKPVVGDWDGDGIDTIGVYRVDTFLLRNSNTNGFADIVFTLGSPGDIPVSGDWDGLP